MTCTKIQDRLDAWVDGELCLEETREVTAHLARCPACKQKAASLTALARALDNLRPIPAPAGFSRQVAKAVRALADPPDLAQWWHHLTLAWRGAVCGAALAGLVFGAVMGTSVAATLDTDGADTPYQALYDSGRLYP